ncbi:hypothetical protein NC651_028094 [Populus alba x Populus x berolinensis]|nr:hypothetical protein NC651_028094 [Populus alba x Populus x berolinensis]
MKYFTTGRSTSQKLHSAVNQALCDLISASEKKMSPHVWTNFPKESSRWSEKGSLLGRTRVEGKTDNICSTVCVIEKLHLSISYVFGLFVFMFEYIQRAIRSQHPARGLLTCDPCGVALCDHNWGTIHSK